MEHTTTSRTDQLSRRPVAERTTAPNGAAASIDVRPEAIDGRKLAAALNNTKRMVAQRKLADALHRSPRVADLGAWSAVLSNNARMVVPRQPSGAMGRMAAQRNVRRQLAGRDQVPTRVGAPTVIQRVAGDPRTGRLVRDPISGDLVVRVQGVQVRFELPAGHGFNEGDYIDFVEGGANAGGRPTVQDPVPAAGPPVVAAAPAAAAPAGWNLGNIHLTVADVLAGAVAPIAPGHNHYLGDVTLTTVVHGVAVVVNVHRNAGPNLQGGAYRIGNVWSLGNAPNALAQAISGHPNYAAAVAAAEARL